MTEVAIAGGGPAGAAYATLLARAGRDAVLVEREREARDKVCGDFLSVEAAVYLRALGVAPEESGAVAIRRLRLSAGARVAGTALPFEAWSLRRRVLDERLLEAATDAGARLLRGSRVEALSPGAGGRWTLRLSGGADPVRARTVALATGKHDLRGWKRPPGRQDDLIGLKWYVRLAPAARERLGDAIELSLFDGGYAGMLPVDDETANLALVVRRRRFAALGRSADALLDAATAENALLRARLSGARFVTTEPVAVAALPYGFVAAPVGAPPGLVRIGDQAAAIPSLSGDGISLALHGAFRAAADPSGSRFARDVRRPVALATAMSRLAVDRRWQGAAVAIGGAAPSLLRLAARLTRLPADSLAG